MAMGLVEDYQEDRKLNLQRDIAMAMGYVDISLVKIQVTAALNRRLRRLSEQAASNGQAGVGQASVIITATIAVPANTTAAVLQTKLASTLGTTADASAALGIELIAAPSIVNVMPPPSAPPPLAPPTPSPPPPVPPPSLPPLPPLQVVSVSPRGAGMTGGQVVHVMAMGLPYSDASASAYGGDKLAYEGDPKRNEHASGNEDLLQCVFIEHEAEEANRCGIFGRNLTDIRASATRVALSAATQLANDDQTVECVAPV